jgi:Na+-transporting methylmalonyl-CoA/oxaloacetate decarboxylase gamma subunit
MENIGILDAGIVALLGYAVVFFGITLLMGVVMVMGKIFVALENKNASSAPDPIKAEPAAAAACEPAAPTAPGSAGSLKLHDVEPKTAAMIMAIVANEMGKPLNELRFISIKEVK